LIVENLNRLSRQDITTAQLLFLQLIDHGLEIVALSDNERRYSKETLALNPFELIVSIMVMSRAHEESKIKSYRVKESWKARNRLAAEGKHINIRLPSWLESKDGKYVVTSGKDAVIKKIFALYLEGYGTQTIAQMLIRDKIPNISKSKSGKAIWHPTYVQRILKSKEVIGYYIGTNPEVPNFFPAIVTESDFYAAQAKLKARCSYRGQKNQNPHPLSHLLKCELCGGSIVRCLGNGYHYFQCQTAMMKACPAKTISIFGTETALLRVIAAATPTKSRSDDQADRESQQQIEAIHGKILELDQKLVAASDLFLETPSEAGTRILQRLEAERARLTQELEARRNSKFLVDHRADWKDVKAQIEANILGTSKMPLEVTPVSAKVVNGAVEFLRHGPAKTENEIIALRESLRSYIDKIVVNIPKMTATIRFRACLKTP
jgi:DNA invertase Pin-like site-specific DNA recombinase